MEIKIFNVETKKIWTEKFESYYFMQKRLNKLKWSKKLKVISTMM